MQKNLKYEELNGLQTVVHTLEAAYPKRYDLSDDYVLTGVTAAQVISLEKARSLDTGGNTMDGINLKQIQTVLDITGLDPKDSPNPKGFVEEEKIRQATVEVELKR